MPHELQTDIATKLIGGQYDATLADSTVIGYTSSQSAGKIEQLGDTFDQPLRAWRSRRMTRSLLRQFQKAMQYLMDNGYLNDILASWRRRCSTDNSYTQPDRRLIRGTPTHNMHLCAYGCIMVAITGYGPLPSEGT